jgi:hypothetical protein
VWVKCEDDFGGIDGPGVPDGQCDLWTVSTSDLSGGGGAAARACLVDDSGVLVDNVKADFTIDVCVIGASCP